MEYFCKYKVIVHSFDRNRILDVMDKLEGKLF